VVAVAAAPCSSEGSSTWVRALRFKVGAGMFAPLSARFVTLTTSFACARVTWLVLSTKLEAVQGGDEDRSELPGVKSGSEAFSGPLRIGLGFGLGGRPPSSGCVARGGLLPGRGAAAAVPRPWGGGCKKVMCRPPSSAAVDVSGSSSSEEREDDSVGEREGGKLGEPAAEGVVDVMPRREGACAQEILISRAVGRGTDELRYSELLSSSSSAPSPLASSSPYASLSFGQRAPFNIAAFFATGSLFTSML
jgi:hypothetical protein